jgi:hypothetical protein
LSTLGCLVEPGIFRVGGFLGVLVLSVVVLLVECLSSVTLLGGCGLFGFQSLNLGGHCNNPLLVVGLLHPISTLDEGLILVLGQEHKFVGCEIVPTFVVGILFVLDPGCELGIPTSLLVGFKQTIRSREVSPLACSPALFS